MKTIYDLKEMYEKEESLLKKVYILATIKKYEKKMKNASTLEDDLLNYMSKDGEINGRRNPKNKRKF